ncbi:MAG: hypothetical protein LBN09_07085 [Clostridioides sp.]|jgi:Na+-driven multidrug efflux pump|nr:hypothetical protein [Clostridioides sp.]
MDIQTKKTLKILNKIAIPLILSTVSGMIMGIVDQAFVGHISVDAYAGVGLVTSSIYSLVGILGATSIAFNIIGSRYKGENEIDKLNDVFTSTLALNFTIGISIFILINIFTKFNSLFFLIFFGLKWKKYFIFIFRLERSTKDRFLHI